MKITEMYLKAVCEYQFFHKKTEVIKCPIKIIFPYGNKSYAWILKR